MGCLCLMPFLQNSMVLFELLCVLPCLLWSLLRSAVIWLDSSLIRCRVLPARYSFLLL